MNDNVAKNWFAVDITGDPVASEAIEYAFNVLGSMLFVPICFAMGRTPITLFAAAIYLAAILWAGWTRQRYPAEA